MIRIKLVPMYFFSLLEVYEDMIEVFLVLEIFLTDDSSLMPACSSVMISTCGFSLFSMIFSMNLLGLLIRLIVQWLWRCCRLPFLGSMMSKDWVHGVGHSPVCQILSQIVVRAVITSSPPAWTSSAVMLSTPGDFPFFSDCTAASTSL